MKDLQINLIPSSLVLRRFAYELCMGKTMEATGGEDSKSHGALKMGWTWMNKV